jgi:hypothetical protein
MRRLYHACLVLFALGILGALCSAVAAPRLPPAPAGFEVVTVHGRWDGDANIQPWLKADDGVDWRLGFPDRGTQNVTLGPLTSDRRVRATGYAATGGGSHYLYVTTLVAE